MKGEYPRVSRHLRHSTSNADAVQQMEFLERIDRADTGWWDNDEMAKQKAAIWNALEQV